MLLRVFRCKKCQRGSDAYLEVYKIISGKYDNNIAINLDINKDSRTRGNLFKLKNRRFPYDLRTFSFSVRIVNLWNSFSNKV